MKKMHFLLLLLIVLAQVVCTSKKDVEAVKSSLSTNKKSEAIKSSLSTNKKVEADKNTVTINDTPGIEVIRFPETGEDILKTSYFADTVLYVPLETNTKSLLREIRGVWVGDSIILINDAQKLLMFKRNGEFVRQIGRNGKGPGEYKYIRTFDVINDTICFSNGIKKSITRYTLDGIFCDEIQVNARPRKMSSTIDGKLAWYNHHRGEVYVHNKGLSYADTIVVEHGLSIGRSIYSRSERFTAFFQKTSSGLFFNDYHNDTIWRIKDNKKEAAYILDMKKELLPEKMQIDYSGGYFTRWKEMVKPYQMAHIIPFASQLFIFKKMYYSDNVERYSAIYLQNRGTKEITKFNSPFIFDDIVGQKCMVRVVFSGSNEFLVSFISPASLLEDVKECNRDNSKKKPSPSWLRQMEKVGENDNPILVLMKIKKQQ